MALPRRTCLLAATLLALVATATPTTAEPASGVPANVVTTGPAAQFYGYTAPVVLTQKGGSITYVNLDIARHDFVQDTKADGVSGPRKRPWCKSYPKRKCPIFWTPTIGVGQETEVRGLARVKPGKTYTFLCTLHPSMSGTLVVAP